jgi:hypothetical protein
MPRFLVTNIDLPAGPPPEVLQQINVAWKRARDLFDSALEIHYEVDAEHGRVSAQLRAFDGSLVEQLSAPEAVALACGDAAPGFADTT